jgi:MFS family permease
MIDSVPVAREGRHANGTLVVLFLSLGGLSFAVLQSLVAPAMPAIARDLHSSTGDISWILTAYLLAASVLTPVLGRLGDMVGKRRVLLAVLVTLAVGTLAAALSTTLPMLIAARVLQGAAGAILPLSIGIVRDELPRERVAVTVGLLSAILGIGGGLGIVAAGPIVDHLSWEWLFWFPLALVVVALAGVAFGVPESPVRTSGRLDVLGATILSICLVSLLLAISKGGEWGWSEAKTVALLVLGAVTLPVFVRVELKAREPLVDVRLMAIRGVWSTNLVGLAFGFAMFGTFVLVPTLVELPKITGYGFGKSVSDAGVFLLPAVVMMLIFSPLSGLLDRRVGPKVLLFAGGVAVTASFAVPALVHDQPWHLLLSVALSLIFNLWVACCRVGACRFWADSSRPGGGVRGSMWSRRGGRGRGRRVSADWRELLLSGGRGRIPGGPGRGSAARRAAAVPRGGAGPRPAGGSTAVGCRRRSRARPTGRPVPGYAAGGGSGPGSASGTGRCARCRSGEGRTATTSPGRRRRPASRCTTTTSVSGPGHRAGARPPH